MKPNFRLLALLTIAADLAIFSADAQTAPSPLAPVEAPAPLVSGNSTPALPTDNATFFDSAKAYFTDLDTNSITFSDHLLFSAGVDSLQQGPVPMANSLRLEYDLHSAKRPAAGSAGNGLSWSIEAEARDSGVTGTIVSAQLGGAVNYRIYDVRLSAYADFGYFFPSTVSDRIFGEIGLRVAKALTTHTYAGFGTGLLLPKCGRDFYAFTGFTF